MRVLLYWLVIQLVASQIQDCPLDWESFQNSCYKFTSYPPSNYHGATRKCTEQGATLVSVNSEAEHSFIVQTLTQRGTSRDFLWFTSGVQAIIDGSYRWEGDGTHIENDAMFWANYETPVQQAYHIGYRYSDIDGAYGWSKIPSNIVIAHICEINRNEAYRIFQGKRDFDFGSTLREPSEIGRGPKFTTRPQKTVIVWTLPAHLDCVADGYPQPTYRWYRVLTNSVVEINSLSSTRYGFSAGRFTIDNPKEGEDAGRYQCLAENKYGSVLSEPVLLSFGYLGEFSNIQAGAIFSSLYEGIYIKCEPPTYNPDVIFQWIKGKEAGYISPDLNGYYMFISSNGKLYFSEVQQNDAGYYSCVVTLRAPKSRSFGLNQPPSKTSVARKLVVRGETATEFGPKIHSDFIYVSPLPPLQDGAVHLECFAYGRMPMKYSWSRENGPMPEGAVLSDANRVLTIPNAKLEDRGTYTCRADRDLASTSDSKSYYLNVEAKPKFVFPLGDQHADIGRQLTWRCQAEAVPTATYAWYKNTKRLTQIPGEVEIIGNSLVIYKLDANRDDGMYQCSATNIHGTSFSIAQLRVLAFKPSFAKYPLTSSLIGAQGGTITIKCRPEAAPTPEISWLHDERDLGLTAGAEGRRMLLDDGSLKLTAIDKSDEGIYTCQATNEYGDDKTSTYLEIVSSIVITTEPTTTEVHVNETAFMYCEVSYDTRQLDVVIMWKLNGYLLDINNDAHYEKGTREGTSGLYIRSALFTHAGTYECNAISAAGATKASAMLIVLGPPAEVGGVSVDKASVTSTSATIRWTNGADHGSPIRMYSVLYHTDYDENWNYLVTGITEESTLVNADDRRPDRRTFRIENLNPFVSYTFRIVAINAHGMSTPSLPSGSVATLPEAPKLAPTVIGGGGGAYGLLQIEWQPLPPVDYAGPGFGYNVYFRKRAFAPDGLWYKRTVGHDVNSIAHLVGVENYYLQYEVKIGTFNDINSGPNSTISFVYSAEIIPPTAPTNVHAAAFNSTAMIVYWTSPPHTREAVGGEIMGFQVNYWDPVGDSEAANGVNCYGTNLTSAMMIGLIPDYNYWVDVQPFNSAGTGPRSEKYLVPINSPAPGFFPRYVEVFSHGAESVKVTWQGITTTIKEEPLRGYKVTYWRAQDDIKVAKELYLDRVFSTVIKGITKGTLYQLRVSGWNDGGDGTMSPTVYFTLSGSRILIDPSVTDILSGGSKIEASLFSAIFISAFNLLR